MSDDSYNDAKVLAAPLGSIVCLDNGDGSSADAEVVLRYEWNGRTLVYVTTGDYYTLFADERPPEWTKPTLKELLVEYERLNVRGIITQKALERLKTTQIMLLVRVEELHQNMRHHRPSEQMQQEVNLWATWKGPKDLPTWMVNRKLR